MIGLNTFRASRVRKTNEKGVTSVEFALVLPAFLLIILGITEMSLIMLTEHLLENAAYNASRTAKTGYVAEEKTQTETVMDVLLARLSGLQPLLDTSKLNVTWKSYGDLSDIGQPDEGEDTMGTASQVVVYTIAYPWHVFTPLLKTLIGDADGNMVLSSRIVVRNEPYD